MEEMGERKGQLHCIIIWKSSNINDLNTYYRQTGEDMKCEIRLMIFFTELVCI